MTTPAFNPLPCDAGAGGAADDVESHILCAVDADGVVQASALAVYTYDPQGNPVGAPEFVDPVTGAPFVLPPGTTLQPCPDGGCGGPIQFCQTGTTTGPVQHPGRTYDITLPINPGFAVQSLQIDSVSQSAGITWEVDDPFGNTFAADLKAFIEGRIAGSTVTVTNPNDGQIICGTAAPMQVHIECLRLDQNPPNLIELVYNAGQDLIINPAYNENPPLNPPVSQGNYGFHLLARQDDPGPFPGNQPSGRAVCTDVANRGWETNDRGRTFEIWGNNIVTGENVTPTPRGTPVQEITSDGPPVAGGRPSTIWQTFVAPASGNFIIRLVHGARDAGEVHRITLDNGDTDDQQNGTLIDDTTTPGVVTSSTGGPGPWTQFSQTIPLTAGQTYTLALSTNNPVGGARGGLFTDMRAFLDRPDRRATAVNDDDTCVVTTTETQTTRTCSFWQPQCSGGRVAGWVKVDTGLVLSNAEFWAQTPTPQCCDSTGSGDGEQSSTLSNLAVSDIVCATLGGVQQNAVRVVVLDPSGGQLSETFLGTDGARIQPASWSPGACTTERTLADAVLCDFGNLALDGTPTSFLRKYVQTWSPTVGTSITEVRDFNLSGNGARYTPLGLVGDCSSLRPTDTETQLVCDVQAPIPGQPPASAQIISRITYDSTGAILSQSFTTLDGQPYTPGGTILQCPNVDTELSVHCDAGNANHRFVRVYNRVDGVQVNFSTVELDGVTPYTAVGPLVDCAAASVSTDPIATTGLCLGDGTPIAVVTRRDHAAGTIITDGWVNLLTGTFSAGAPPVGTTACGSSRSIELSGVLCDVSGGTTVNGLVLVEYHYAADGSIESTRLVNATTGATYVPVGTITVCPEGTSQPDRDMELLCDVAANGTVTPFIRDYQRNSTGAITGSTSYTLGGAAYAPTGTVGSCSAKDSETFILCDSAAVPVRFLRTYTYKADGSVAAFTDSTFAGAAFTPTGAVGTCATTTTPETDVQQEILCDANGTQFIRRWLFNSATGAVTSTVNLTLAGAAFTPVGAVGLCSNCCPVVVGEGCTNTGSGRYVATRAANGTITLQDSVTGATVTQAQIIACPDQPVTVVAEGRIVADADTPWSPGNDVIGRLTSVTLTVLSGTANVVDGNGTALTGLPAGYTASWDTQDDHNTLTGPTSIDAVGGSTVVVWTRV
ncbi:hypothetical protein SEA_MISCHIEF19_18 [Streptomyces phage Mischief19]|nr:hypothetical protein SEA_MISCHIEF19_18 [Streptomyces phage Mischief19]